MKNNMKAIQFAAAGLGILMVMAQPVSAQQKEKEGLGEYDAAMPTIKQMQSPYGIYISPHSGHLYVSDSRGYATNGYVYEFDRDGSLLNKYSLKGINPAHFLALP